MHSQKKRRFPQEMDEWINDVAHCLHALIWALWCVKMLLVIVSLPFLSCAPFLTGNRGPHSLSEYWTCKYFKSWHRCKTVRMELHVQSASHLLEILLVRSFLSFFQPENGRHNGTALYHYTIIFFRFFEIYFPNLFWSFMKANMNAVDSSTCIDDIWYSAFTNVTCTYYSYGTRRSL